MDYARACAFETKTTFPAWNVQIHHPIDDRGIDTKYTPVTVEDVILRSLNDKRHV